MGPLVFLFFTFYLDLLEAAKTGNITDVKQLITAGVNIEGKDSQGIVNYCRNKKPKKTLGFGLL